MDRNDRRRLNRILSDPDLGPRFRRLGKRQQADILVNLRGAAARARVRELDAARREKVRQRSADRRRYRRAVESAQSEMRDRVARRIEQYYGLNPQYAANLRANLAHADPLTLRRLADADNDALRRIIASQEPDGATRVFHYHRRMA